MAQNGGLVRDGPYQGRQIPTSLLHTSPVALHRERRELPLDLIQRIISYIEDVGDIARVTRSSRLFYYMALPRLYESVTLKSYPELRYIDGQVEGYGGGSPFSMGLNGLVTRNVAAYVRKWSVQGEWRERDVEEFSKGRIPDNSMMLNIAIRAAMDRMAILESFSWGLNAKPMPTIYQGLAGRSTLRSLTIKSPTQRLIRPTCLVPPIPSLKSLKVTDIDPLCYPDDFSLLLLQSKNLEELNLHWSPRMREQGEPSINLHSIFGKCIAAGYRMPLKRVGIQNLYAINHGELPHCIQHEKLERISFINNVDSSNPKTIFFDRTWIHPNNMKDVPKNLKMMRGEALSREHAEMVSRIKGLEEFYVINKKGASRKATPNGGSSAGNSGPTVVSPATPGNSEPPTPSLSHEECVGVASDYLGVLSRDHGPSLRILLLSDQWHLGETAVTNLMRSCPNLEQIGLALEDNNIDILRKMMPLAPKLYAIRLLISLSESLWEKIVNIEDDLHVLAMSHELWRDVYKNIRWVGMGRKAYKVGGIIRDEDKNPPRGSSGFVRSVKPTSWEEASCIEIFGLDCMELV
ncbi:hypothetical protein NA57DRAFT_33159 [Rhizodiscina lignyota]|uniref:F-box domain-containing protein n=1 Tax=Rhizodiscina lignyota TaxID=1504668 RepID=A0A9P4MEZ6_9PEZI|nr:hypothetical protein NA57DRAFT_33159 [Rhizodiscina lignyota]